MAKDHGKLIVDAIREKVIPTRKPAVYISGGIDSCIVLHHLREKFNGEIRTFTAIFGDQNDRVERVEAISKDYGTVHHFVDIEDFVFNLRGVMEMMPFKEPRYNIWPYWLACRAKDFKCENVYIGEGSDEIFGGYDDRDFLTGWAGQITYVRPTFDIIHDWLGLKLHAPFSEIDWLMNYFLYYKPPQKEALRRAYKGLLPDYVIDVPAEAPRFTNYKNTWRRELRDYVEFDKPEEELTKQDIKDALQLLATDAWVKARGMRLRK